MRFPISNKDNNNIARLHSLKIGIIGGTGGMGKGFAIRWCINHDILVGSRDAERASKSAEEYTNTAKEAYGKINGSISGNDNVSIAKESDVLVLSIPYENIESTCSQILPHIKDKSKLVSAFHVISEKKLVNPTLTLDYDIFVCGDDQNSVNVVNGLINKIKGLRPIYLGPGSFSYFAEVATPLLLNAMIKNKLKNPGIKII